MGAVGRMMLVAEPLNGCGFDMARFGWKMEGKLHWRAIRCPRMPCGKLVLLLLLSLMSMHQKS